MGSSWRACACAAMVAAILAGIPAPLGAEWVAGVYLGAAHTTAAPLDLLQPPDTDVRFASVSYRGDSFEPPLYYGYRLAYYPTRRSWLGMEAELIHLKVYARTARVTRTTGRHLGTAVDREAPVRDILDAFSISHGLNLIFANLVVRKAAGDTGTGRGRLMLLGRAGAGPTVPHPESRIAGVQRESYELGALGLQLAGGVEVRAWRGLALSGEYKFTRTKQRVSVNGGEASGRFASHHLAFGLAWHF